MSDQGAHGASHQQPKRRSGRFELLEGGGEEPPADEVVPVPRGLLEELQQDQITLLNILGARPLGDAAVLEAINEAELAPSWLLAELV